ncbi:hemin uptake protein HemP [Rhizobium sullae]|uniref:Hemin uptake protein HemP n=2 Tax=Rhizobium sullae TaxID=50338 RepID=A0ABY5XEW6_RHISU|nr:hemin uptake protein HemP [Rhizobium sullae]UWU13015.1 hemin uptake protein HemP [Rhizobium sullae]
MKVKLIVSTPEENKLRRQRKLPTKMMVEKPDTFMHAPLPREGAEIRTIESADIFRGANEIMIRHDGVVYRMKITRQGKLILNK